jgi:hypothetical protein
MTKAYLPYGVSVVELDCHESCRIRITHDGAIMFVRQIFDGEGAATARQDEIEIAPKEARILADLLVAMADMLECCK